MTTIAVTSDLATALREWARGMNTLVAATEMLIRADYVMHSNPWVRFDEDNAGRPWIDFEAIPDLIGGLSGGERRFLLIAASIATDVAIPLGDNLAGLDRTHAQLVLAAVAHAAGYGQAGRSIGFDADGEPALVEEAALHEWPARV